MLEYKIQKVSLIDTEDASILLSKFGAQGWKVIHVFATPHAVLLERELVNVKGTPHLETKKAPKRVTAPEKEGKPLSSPLKDTPDPKPAISAQKQKIKQVLESHE